MVTHFTQGHRKSEEGKVTMPPLCSCLVHDLMNKYSVRLSHTSRVSVEPRHPPVLWRGWRPRLFVSCAHDLVWDVQIVIKLFDIFVRVLAMLSLNKEKYSNIISSPLSFFFFTSSLFSDRKQFNEMCAFFSVTNYSQEASNTAAVTDSLMCSLDCSSIIQFSILYTIFL